MMDSVKARKQGNSVMVTLSSSLGISAGQEFYITKTPDDSILLVPKVTDIYQNVRPGEFDDIDDDHISRNFQPQGKELADD